MNPTVTPARNIPHLQDMPWMHALPAKLLDMRVCFKPFRPFQDCSQAETPHLSRIGQHVRA